ncbi:hypothetical protein KO498_05470 [Lentibacter algarum]|uniref:hypothetical protein n=1 Tax=Lentibacter algarum TaxID=576131 RepID=UPI001C07524B|nr:hypothetical protein [Lentibacter algarum]MBU2981257.1 hypothetical protein [Lentibacter algarum]
MSFVRLMLLWAVGCSVIYFAVSIFARSLRREALEKRWRADNAGADVSGREAYVEEGMTHYEAGPWPWVLRICIYLVPLFFIAIVHIFTTYY